MLVRRCPIFVALVLSLLALGAGGATAATPGEVATFEVPTLCFPTAISAAAREGVLLRLCEQPNPSWSWAEDENGVTLATLRPDGAVEKTAVPAGAAGPTAVGPAGDTWVTANPPEYLGGPLSIDHLAADGTVRQFPIAPAIKGGKPHVLDLTLAADWSAWAAVGEGEPIESALNGSVGGQLVHIATDGTVASFPLPHGIEPWSLVYAPDGNVWFTGVRGRYRAEHTFRPGVAYVGRITPTGQLSLFRMPKKGDAATAIAVGPDGKLWFSELGAARVGTIGLDGKFGREYVLRVGPPGDLAIGPEGDAWMPVTHGIARLTPAGQQTLFDAAASRLAVGAEGNIWGGGEGAVVRLTPGAPGIDVWGIAADPSTGKMSVRLACGGSTSACAGTLEVKLPFRPPARHGRRGRGKRHLLRLVQAEYSVAAESEATVTAPIPARGFKIAQRLRDESRGHFPPEVQVTATVVGGPTLQRSVPAPSLSRAD
jgi:virginiamycin B lyase